MPQASPEATAWLNQQRQAVQPVAPVVPVVPQRPRLWRMTLLEGSEVRQVDLDDNNQFPDLSGEVTDQPPTGEPVDSPLNAPDDAPVNLGGDNSQELPPGGTPVQTEESQEN